MVTKSAVKTHGIHALPVFEANELTSFKTSSTDLFKTIAKLAIRIATSHLIFFLLLYNSCQLIGLDKSPGLRPIGIREVLWQNIGRTIVKCGKTDLKLLGGDQQLCIGQKGGNEHAIHSLRAAIKGTDSEAILLIDAKNAAIISLNGDLVL